MSIHNRSRNQALITLFLATTACGSVSEEGITYSELESAVKSGGQAADKNDKAADKNTAKNDKVAHKCKHKGHKAKDCKHDHHHGGPQPADPLTFTPASAAKKFGRLAGAAVAYGPLTNEEVYRNVLAAEFNYVTPENEMKWGSLQNTTNHRVWDFEQADAIVEFAQQNDMKVKGHALIWHSQTPSFITNDLERRELRHLMKKHIHKTMSHFRGDVHAWDVVNEAVADDGSGLRDSIFSQLMGDRFIAKAFRQAKLADRKPTMIYNDYGTENLGAKSDALLALMQDMLARRVPIDEVGFQAHFDARFAPSKEEMVANFERFGDLGLDVNISELDVRVSRVSGNQAHKLAVQKEIYKRVAAACVEAENCKAVTTWGFTDKHSWVDGFFGADDPLLFDENYQKKPAYFGFVDGFLGVPLDAVGMAPNLVGNSTFETGTDQWAMMGNGTLSVSKAHAHTGFRSAIAQGRTDTWQGPSYNLATIVSRGRTYDAEIFTRLGSGSSTVNLTAQITCAGQDTNYVQVGNVAANDSGWSRIGGTLQVPDCDLQGIVLYAEGPAAGVDILVDDLAVREQALPNLLGNGGFESGTSGWFGLGATFSTTSDAHSGDLAGIATGRTASWNGVGTNITSTVASDAAYQVDAFVKVAGAASAPVNLTAKIRCVGGSDQYIGLAYGTATNNGWVALSGQLNVPNCSLEEVLVYAEGPAAGIDILMDDVSLVRKADTLGPNVVNNPGFESGTNYWYGFGAVNVSASSAQPYSGAASGLVSGRTASWQGLAQTITANVVQGQSYQVQAFARIAGAASSPVNLSVKTNCDGTDSFGAAASGTATDSGWVALDGALSVPTCGLNELTIYIEGAPAGVDIFLDDVSVRQVL